VKRSFCLLVLLALLSACYSGSRPPHIGAAAPDFTVQDAQRKVTLHDLRGQIVVLNFWATWCPPCVEEMPSLEQLQQRYKSKGVVVLGVSIDDDDAAYRQFLTDHKVDFLTVRDDSKHSSILYGTFKYPETYIIDRNGVVRRKFIGAVEWGQPEIVEYLNRLQG
jgi:cytochrome c biogenesis protein CcmG/thiol:disulfide interchange protein DsbE